MGEPKLHHYVPQFHMRRFLDEKGRLWVWDRDLDRVFSSKPSRIAAEKDFYRLSQYEVLGHDALTLEKQLSSLEGEVAKITTQWLGWLRVIEPSQKITIPETNRGIVSLFTAVQYLRTVDTRNILAALAVGDDKQPVSPVEQRRLHTELLWDEAIIQTLVSRFQEGIWIFARNNTQRPFVTSDNPVSFRTRDNRFWLRAGITGEGVYCVFALAPDIVFYIYPNEEQNRSLKRFNDCLSPVTLTEEMIESENSGQVFMSSRFVVSNQNDFSREREFAKTIKATFDTC